MSRTRKVILIILVAFAIYAVYRSPDQAGDFVANLWDILMQGLDAVGAFFNSVLSG